MTVFHDPQRVYPQSAAAINSDALRADVLAATQRQESGLDSGQALAAIGQTAPIVFGRRVNNIGGVWLSPPAIRWAFQTNAGKITFNALVVLNDGRCASPATTDVYHGSAKLNTVENGYSSASYGSYDAGLFNFANSIKLADSYLVTEQYDAAEGPAGLPLPDPALAYRTSPNEIKVSSRGPNVVSFSATITGKTIYQFKGPLMEGQPWYIRDRAHSSYSPDKPTALWAKYTWAALSSKVFTKTVTDTGVVWNQAATQVTNADGSKTYSARFYNPSRSGAGALYPRNITPHSGTITQSIIDTALQLANNEISLTSQPVTALSCLGARGASNISSAGTTMTIVADSYKVTVSETNRYYYPDPTGYSAEPGSGGTLSGLMLLAAKGTYKNQEGKHGRQVHVFVRDGVYVERLIDGAASASSNVYPDLVYYLMTRVSLVPTALIDKDAMKAAAQFTAAQQFYFNGVVQYGVNLRSWMAETAPFFLLQVTQYNGRYGLRPALPVNGTAISANAVTPVFTFTEDTIIEQSFARQSVEASELKPFIAVIVWRDQSETNVGTTKTVEVRYTDSPVQTHQEQYDISAFCVTEAHARMAARYLLAKRRHIKHTATWSATIDAGILHPGDIVRVTLPIVSSGSANGTYDELFQITEISESASGGISITATGFAVDSSGRSMIAMDVLSGAFS